MLIYKQRKVDRDFGASSSPDIRREGAAKGARQAGWRCRNGRITDGKRAWGFVISSGRNRLWLDTALAGS